MVPVGTEEVFLACHDSEEAVLLASGKLNLMKRKRKKKKNLMNLMN